MRALKWYGESLQDALVPHIEESETEHLRLLPASRSLGFFPLLVVERLSPRFLLRCGGTPAHCRDSAAFSRTNALQFFLLTPPCDSKHTHSLKNAPLLNHTCLAVSQFGITEQKLADVKISLDA